MKKVPPFCSLFTCILANVFNPNIVKTNEYSECHCSLLEIILIIYPASNYVSDGVEEPPHNPSNIVQYTSEVMETNNADSGSGNLS